MTSCRAPRTLVACACLVVWSVSGTPATVAMGQASGPEPGAQVASPVSDPAMEPGAVVTEDLLDVDGMVVATRARMPDGSLVTPTGDAVSIDGEWWSPVGKLEPVPAVEPPASLLRRITRRGVLTGDPDAATRIADAAIGDVTLDGEPDLVVSFRRPFRRTFINTTRPRRMWIDARGLSAHVGVYRPADLDEEWVAGTLLHPIVRLAACDGALAVAYGRLRAPGVFATGAGRWLGFGFLTAGLLPGAGRPVCVDVDRDGRTEPAIVGRTGP